MSEGSTVAFVCRCMSIFHILIYVEISIDYVHMHMQSTTWSGAELERFVSEAGICIGLCQIRALQQPRDSTAWPSKNIGIGTLLLSQVSEYSSPSESSDPELPYDPYLG